MDYSKLVAVTGLPGLFELINSKTDGAIVRSLDDRTTRFVSSRVHQFSHLESIEVYTVRDNVNLVDVFLAMEKAGGSLPDDKDSGEVRSYFEKVYPDIDFERVYNSDMKKMVKWFAVLKKNNVEIKLTEVPEEEEVIEEVKAEPVAKEKKPAKKTAKKKEETAEAVKEEKPAKKASTSKAKKEDAPKPAKKTATKKK